MFLRFSITGLFIFTALVAVELAMGLGIGLLISMLLIFICVIGLVLSSFVYRADDGRPLPKEHFAFRLFETSLLLATVNLLIIIVVVWYFPSSAFQR